MRVWCTGMVCVVYMHVRARVRVCVLARERVYDCVHVCARARACVRMCGCAGRQAGGWLDGVCARACNGRRKRISSTAGGAPAKGACNCAAEEDCVREATPLPGGGGLTTESRSRVRTVHDPRPVAGLQGRASPFRAHAVRSAHGGRYLPAQPTDGWMDWPLRAPSLQVPIFITANDLSTMYAPILRDGRMEKFMWEPSRQDIVSMLEMMYRGDGFTAQQMAELYDTFHGQTLDFFGALRVSPFPAHMPPALRRRHTCQTSADLLAKPTVARDSRAFRSGIYRANQESGVPSHQPP